MQRCDFALGSASITGNNGAGMSHALSWRGCASRNKGNNRFAHGLDVLGRVFLVAATDFSTHDYKLRLWVLFKQLQVINERRANNGVTTNAYTCGLTKVCLGQ